jgi:cytidine deaminase
MVKHSMLMYFIENLILKREAQTANGKDLKFKHMCVIVTKKGEPLSYGYNVYDLKNQITEHAEEMALRILIENKERLYSKKKPLYLIVARTNGCNSKPCARCLELIEKNLHIINIRHICYTHENEEDGIKMDKLKTLIMGEKFVSSYSRFLTKQINAKNKKL